MAEIKYNTKMQEKLVNLIPDKDGFDYKLLEQFITYWWVRKSNSFLSKLELNEIKQSLSDNWLELIESNHKFREKYGEEKASKIIKLVEENGIQKELTLSKR